MAADRLDAADDLSEALIIAAGDGIERVPYDILLKAVSLLKHGTDAGEFFSDFREYYTA